MPLNVAKIFTMIMIEVKAKRKAREAIPKYVGRYNFRRADITEIKKYITRSCTLGVEEIAMLMKGLAVVETEYDAYMGYLRE